MLESFARWPTWYLLLIAYTGVLALSALRAQARVDAVLRQTLAPVTDPRERGRLTGVRGGGWTRASTWPIAAILLLTGAVWALTIVAAVYVLSAKKAYLDSAQGFAEGRKAVTLAAAPEYVHGRVPPRTADYVVAAVIVGAARIVPFAATVVAMKWLPR